MAVYRKVSCAYWDGELAEELRGDPVAHTVAFYLMTCRSTNPIGCYRLSAAQISDDTGIDPRRALEALRKLSETRFVVVDERFRMVFVVEFARHEWGERPNPADNRVKRLVNMLPDMLSVCRKSLIWQHFYDRYRESWASIFEALPEGLRDASETSRRRVPDQDQDQDQDQEEEATPPRPPKGGKRTGRKIPAVTIPEALVAIGIDREAFARRVETCNKTKRPEAWQSELDLLARVIPEVGKDIVSALWEESYGTGWQGVTPTMCKDRAARAGQGRRQSPTKLDTSGMPKDFQRKQQ